MVHTYCPPLQTHEVFQAAGHVPTDVTLNGARRLHCSLYKTGVTEDARIRAVLISANVMLTDLINGYFVLDAVEIYSIEQH